MAQISITPTIIRHEIRENNQNFIPRHWLFRSGKNALCAEGANKPFEKL
jgi:hypothetical protein